MIGCQFSCPMCKRKCDQPDDMNHKHFCLNGHQYRGMNGVLQSNRPSFLICEDINDNALITTLETSTQKKWKDIKNAYSEWNFRSLSDENIQMLKNKMKEIWNSGTGALICKELTKRILREIHFQESTDIPQYPIHFILILDDSGSMKGDKWENARHGAIQCMKDIQKNLDAKVSLIIFNDKARVIIDCEKADIEKQQEKITFQGGQTSFSEAFLAAYNQINNHYKKQFLQNIILFYTDGGDSYPEIAVQKFCQLPLAQRQTIELISCADGTQVENASLLKIQHQFKRNKINAELKTNIKVELIKKVWTEVVSQKYHQLKE